MTAPMGTKAAPTPSIEVRTKVRDVLLRSPAYRQLRAEQQQQIARDMAQVADYLCKPEGIPGNTLPTAAALADSATPDVHGAFQENLKQVNKVGQGFKAQAALQGAEVAGALLKQVNFVVFVSGLIEGVFHSIVKSSIEQMEAYGKLVAGVAKSLNQFRDENVSDNQGRDHLVEQFADVFKLGSADGGDFFGAGSGEPRLQLQDGVDEDSALKRVNASLPTPVKSLDLSDEDNEQALVQSARTQLATSRQQLLATMVLMGINRIVVTDGKIQAKILYDFQARDNARMQRSAVAYDYATDSSGNVQKTTGMEGESEVSQGGSEYTRDKDSADYKTGDYYAKGKYKYTEQPIMTAMSAATETSEASLQTKASLAGVVDINFKSDYFPLEKMADSFQIAQIQNASKPGRGAAAAPAGSSAASGRAVSPSPAAPGAGAAPAPAGA